MSKKLVLFFLAFLWMATAFAKDDRFEEAINGLQAEIAKAADYDRNHLSEISSLKQELSKADKADLTNLFHINEKLYNKYRVFQYDSAYHYASEMKNIAEGLNNPALVNMARIKLGFSLLSSGMYKETLDLLSGMDLQQVADSNKAEYYTLMGRYYYDLGDFDNDRYHTPAYTQKGNEYIDSALAVLPPNSNEYLYYRGLKALKTGDGETASTNFHQILSRPGLDPHQVAIVASTLSDLHIKRNENDQAILLLIRSVIADIQSSTRETSAAFTLATLLYKKGDIKNASVCINRAFADAVFFGARQRKVQVSAILPLIEAQKFAIVETQKTRITWYAILSTFLLLLVVGLALIVFKQVKKLKQAQTALLEAHQKTQEVNKQLLETNARLNDANRIKEEYIGYFFNANSEFFDKIEKFKKSVEQKLAERKTDDIKFLVNNINLKKEKNDLLKHFDRAFLRLFPNFVPAFNDLFEKENRVVLEEDELLNTDLRIFALIRMGIYETDKIAHILQYSVNTINTYKTRIKNKSTVPNEEFELRIMQIHAV